MLVTRLRFSHSQFSHLSQDITHQTNTSQVITCYLYDPSGFSPIFPHPHFSSRCPSPSSCYSFPFRNMLLPPSHHIPFPPRFPSAISLHHHVRKFIVTSWSAFKAARITKIVCVKSIFLTCFLNSMKRRARRTKVSYDFNEYICWGEAVIAI